MTPALQKQRQLSPGPILVSAWARGEVGGNGLSELAPRNELGADHLGFLQQGCLSPTESRPVGISLQVRGLPLESSLVLQTETAASD